MLAKGKQNVSACIFDVETSCACALEPRIYNDCGNWIGPSTGLDPIKVRRLGGVLEVCGECYNIG